MRSVTQSMLLLTEKLQERLDVKVGDVIEIRMGDNLLKAQVLVVSEHATKNDASLMYKIL